MSPRITLATAARVLLQLRHDPRTVALILVVPCMLLTLMKYIFDAEPQTFQKVGVTLLGIFPLSTMFIVTSITMLRERTTGTLERLMTMPIHKIDLLFGYGIAFALMASLQALAVSGLGFGLLGLETDHSVALVFGLAIGNAILGMALGLFASAFANTEFQAVQFMPAIIMPQIILCGLFVPTDKMAPALEAASQVLPMTYAYDGLARATMPQPLGSDVVIDAAVILGSALLALILGALTLRRRTP